MPLFVRSGWRDLKDSPFEWVAHFNGIMGRFAPPYFAGPTLYLASDYSGTHKGSRYEAISVLVTDLEDSSRWHQMRTRMRRDVLRDSRRIAYKNLNDKRRAEALPIFLQGSDSLTAICVTVLINRSIAELLYGRETLQFYRQEFGLQARWKPRTFESMLRVTHLMALLSAGLSRPGQRITWISDEDDLFATGGRKADVMDVFTTYLGYYMHNQPTEISFATAGEDTEGIFEDLLAIPDLAAGAACEIGSQLSKLNKGRIPEGLGLYLPRNIPEKTNLIGAWLMLDEGNLRKATLVFEKNPRGYLLARMKLGLQPKLS